MSNPKSHSREAAELGLALTVAPAAFGCALGILMGDKMGKRVRHSAAFAFFAMGAAAALPLAADFVTRRVNNLETERGQRRQRRLIRDGALPAEMELYELEAFDAAS